MTLPETGNNRSYVLDHRNLQDVLGRLSGASVAVLGDFCLDIYWTIDRSASEPSVETGLQTEPIREQRYSLGGAGNVVINLLALGVEHVYPVGVVGNDPFGRELRRLLESPSTPCKGLVTQAEDWATPTYVKPHANNKELSRIDLGYFNHLSQAAEEEIFSKLDEILPEVNIILVNHQITGSCHDSASFRSRLNRVINCNPQKTFIVDSRGYHEFYPAAIHKLNDHECMNASGKSVGTDEPVFLEDLIRQGRILAQRWNSPLVITRGERGCLAVVDGKVSQVLGLQLPGLTDPVGAGDAFSATLVACLSTGTSLVPAAFVANIAAAVTVQKIHQTGTASPEEILDLGLAAEFVHSPELAEDPRRARFVEDSEIELIADPSPALNIRHAIFDHDGTISTLREGWEQIMQPMMEKSILGDQYETADEALLHLVAKRAREFIQRTTGIQTITQMQGLVQLVREFGQVPQDKIRTAAEYKEIFNEELIALVNKRIGKLDRGELNVSDFTIKGALPFLRSLKHAGVRLYLASGTDADDVKREAMRLGYGDLFEGRIYGSVGQVDKDAKKIVVDRILAEIGGDSEGLVTFGDGPVEMRETACHKALAIGIASDELRRFGMNNEKRTRLIRSGAGIVIPDFSQWEKLQTLLHLRQPELPIAPHPQLDRTRLLIRGLSDRPNKVSIERAAVSPQAVPAPMEPAAKDLLMECVARIHAARNAGRPVMLAFGAHTIKNGLAPALIKLMEDGWVTLLATNGAGIIHDWEFAFQGASSEDVRTNVDHGEFGIWAETGFNLNLALVVGAFEGLGYGESVGKMILRDGLDIPDPAQLLQDSRHTALKDPGKAAAILDLLDTIHKFDLQSGFHTIHHPYKQYSAQAAALRLHVPFTAHPMIGHDIIYTHPMNNGAAIGRVALRDFLTYAEQVHQLQGGVYLSVGSAVMSPMVFEKSLSMSQNLELQQGNKITDHFMFVVDLAQSSWDWQKDGEPSADNPAYYLRYCKTFSRMGGTMRYLCSDNRNFLLTLLQELER